jgi:hypothetical protein
LYEGPVRLALAGLKLTDSEAEKLHLHVKLRDLLLKCPSVLKKPGRSDIHYSYKSKEVLLLELRKAILKAVRGWKFKFEGSLMEGPRLDLLELAGLELTDSERDDIWGETNPRDLLLKCPSVYEMEDYTIDEMPGYSDIYYKYEAPSKEVLVLELRKAILKIIGKKK